ncbi:DoxX family protein [Agrobacterium pusense]|uniref:DoxX family protein n=1 Tax=Agrobacterium pusense TaxID=648995 RepID=UPI00156B7BAC|nr:DoxX family protein [Agrobacterium pusense]QKJ94435.1 DoxX family protein [Agrobacterium pusense]
MIENTGASYAALLLRIFSGAYLIGHFLIKVFVFTVPGTVAFFESVGFPGFFAYLAMFAELAGGIALVLGVGTRAAALATLPVLLGAIPVHAGNGWAFNNPGGGWEYPALWSVLQVALILLGGGALRLKVPVVERLLGRFA